MINLSSQAILLVSPEGWGDLKLSKHHYALQLAARGNQVYFLNPPSKANQVRTLQEGLYLLDYKPTTKGLGKMPIGLASMFTKKEVSRLEKLAGVSFDVIWNFDTSRFFALGKLKDKVRIAHLVDLNQHFQREKLAQSADLTLAISTPVLDAVKTHTTHVHMLKHAYGGPRVSPQPYIPRNRPIAGYVGNLTMEYIDWKLLLQLATQHPEVDFQMVGPEKGSNLSAGGAYNPEEKEQFRKLDNVSFLGPKPSEEVLPFLQNCDLLLVTYRKKDFPDQLTGSHKLMEYLASGRITLTTRSEDYIPQKELMLMCRDEADFLEQFTRAIANLEKYNSIEKQSERIEWAVGNSYSKQIDQIASWLAEVKPD